MAVLHGSGVTQQLVSRRIIKSTIREEHYTSHDYAVPTDRPPTSLCAATAKE
jgi:hypothetical protein